MLERPTPSFKLKWLKKRKEKYSSTVTLAYYQIRKELVDFLNNYKKEPDSFIKYLANCVLTDNVQTFIKLIEDIIKTADECKGDSQSSRAKIICQYILIRFNLLSKCTLTWTTIKLYCNTCRKIHSTNYLFTDRLCPYCGNIVLN